MRLLQVLLERRVSRGRSAGRKSASGASARPWAEEKQTAIFSDIELVFVQEVEPRGTLAVAFDVIYAGETWCRSVVWVEPAVTARLEYEEPAVIRAARDALLDLLVAEPGPVALELRLAAEGVSLLARGTPGPRF